MWQKISCLRKEDIIIAGLVRQQRSKNEWTKQVQIEIGAKKKTRDYVMCSNGWM